MARQLQRLKPSGLLPPAEIALGAAKRKAEPGLPGAYEDCRETFFVLSHDLCEYKDKEADKDAPLSHRATP